jgi:hypothetical protein
MNGAIDAQALGGLLDDDDGGFASAIAQLEHELERQDDLTRRLRDQCRYQHLVLSDIYGLANPDRLIPCDDIRSIRCKAQAALSAASKSGLLA